MPFAKLSHPATSHEAADSVAYVTVVQSAILNILREGSMSDEQLVIEYQRLVKDDRAQRASEQGIRSRRSELARLRLVSVVGYTLTSFGRRAQVWGATNV